MITIAALIQWITIGEQVWQKGEGLWNQIKQVLADNGIDADTSKIDESIADADRRKGIAENEARG